MASLEDRIKIIAAGITAEILVHTANLVPANVYLLWNEQQTTRWEQRVSHRGAEIGSRGETMTVTLILQTAINELVAESVHMTIGSN